MGPRAVVFLPENPFPAQYGFHHRALEILRGLVAIGCEVTVVSSTIWTESTRWDQDAIVGLTTDGVKDVHVYTPRWIDRRALRVVAAYHRHFGIEATIDSADYGPIGMQVWMDRVLRTISPDIVLMNYARWDPLLNVTRWGKYLRQWSTHRAVHVIDSHDLMTRSLRMRRALDPYLPPQATDIDEAVLREDFFESRASPVDDSEYRIYDKYDVTIAITEAEAALIRHNTRHTDVIHLPVTREPVLLDNRYTGPALLATGPNPFNVQGCLYFAKRVLPAVRRRAPSFCLQVTGYCCGFMQQEPGVSLAGFVPDLRTLYGRARFAICPVFGGTGQQVKIVEAMAHGVAVIALRAPAAGSPIRHGVNGLIADNAEEFADQVVRLWNDDDLCRRLGDAARETIRGGHSTARLVETLSSMVQRHC